MRRGSRAGPERPDAERGAALLLVMMLVVVLSAVGLAVSVASRTETLIAASFRQGREGLYAAEGAIAVAAGAAATLADWNGLLGGGVTAPFADGPSSGARVTPGGERITLCCGAATLTGDVQARALGGRNWGPDTPQWQLFAWGPAAGWLPAGRVESVVYVAVWVADDPRDGDGNPAADSNGVIELHAQALGASGGRRRVEATLQRQPPAGDGAGGPGVRIVSWREVTW